MRRLATFGLFLITALFAFAAFAQDAGVSLDSEEAIAKLVLDSVVNKQWGLLASVALTGLVWLLRKYTPETTVLGKWFRSKVGGVVTPFLLALGGGFVTVTMAGTPITVALVIKVVSLALGASGVWTNLKNLREAVEEKKAVTAGVDAEKKPDDVVNQ